MKLGAHLSIAGGYKNALHNIVKIGGSSLQIFSSSPRSWNFAKITDSDAQEFISIKKALQIDPVFFHATYLINLADDGKIGHLSKLSLISELTIASKLHVIGSIVHLGSYKTEKTNEKYTTLITHIKEILEKSPQNTQLIIENAGNNKIGKSLDEIAQIIKDISNSRVTVCLDTCHLYSAGYDLSSSEKLEKFLKEFENKIGLKRISVFHFNDSKDPISSSRDKHENIGSGTIPIEEFKLIMNHPKLSHLPFIIETPGFDNKGPDKKNLDILKRLLS